MVAIITGDIINSDKSKPDIWLPILKDVLNMYGKSPSKWKIYRGDSFQVELKPKEALYGSILIKASIKQIENLDARMAIGIGDKEYKARNITESNGSAFVNSGRCFEALKKNNLAVKSPWEDFDLQINTMLELALLTMDRWTSTSSVVLQQTMLHPKVNQNALAKKMDKKQSNISGALNRGGYYRILKMIDFYEKNMIERC